MYNSFIQHNVIAAARCLGAAMVNFDPCKFCRNISINYILSEKQRKSNNTFIQIIFLKNVYILYIMCTTHLSNCE